MGSQSTAKTIFLLVSMTGWLVAGAALIYSFPLLASLAMHSKRTDTWMETLDQSGYRPNLGLAVCGIILSIEIISNWIWYGRLDKKA